MCLYLKLLHKILNFSSGYFLHALGTSWPRLHPNNMHFIVKVFETFFAQTDVIINFAF